MARSPIWLAALSALLACNGTRTGNPYDEAPTYQTSSRFAAEGPSHGGNPSTGGPDGGGLNNPGYSRSSREYAALYGSYLAIAGGPGVLVFDLSDRTAPELAAELPIDGYVYQAVADETGMLLAVSERITLDEEGIPIGPLPVMRDRLVRVDLTDPTRPTRTFERDLEGSFWELVVRGSSVFVLERMPERSDELCDYGGLLPEGPQPLPMRLTRYTLTAADASLDDTLDVPVRSQGAGYVGDGWVMAGEGANGAELHLVDFTSGELVQRGPLPIVGQLVGASRVGDTLALLLDHEGTLTLSFASLDGSALQERGSLVVGGNGELAAVTLLPEGTAIVQSRSVQLIDARDLDAPVLASRLPDDVMRLFQAPAGLVGLGNAGGPDSTGNLVISVWDVSDAAAPLRVSELATDWIYSLGDPGIESFTLEDAQGLLLVPYGRPGATSSAEAQIDVLRTLGVVDVSSTSVALHSEQATQADLWRPFSDGTSAFNLGGEGLEVFPLERVARETTPGSALVPVAEASPIDQIDAGDFTVALWERKDAGEFYLEVTLAAGGEATTIELPHRGDALVTVGERVAVVGLGGFAAECEHLVAQGVEPSQIPEIVEQFSSNPCGPRRARGVSLLAPGGESLSGTVSIRSDRDFDSIEGVVARADWHGYVQLDDGRLVFLVERGERCDSHETCEDLGVPAYESMASPGCNTQVQDCASLPSVITLVSGYRNGLGVYTLEVTDSGQPRLELGAVLEGRFDLYLEGAFDLRHRVLSTEDGLALAHEDPLYNSEGNSVIDEHGDAVTRFYLERVTIDADGELVAQERVNTPGLPVAVEGDSVYCLEPKHGSGEAIRLDLHRASLHGSGAFIEETVTVGEQLVEARRHGDALYVLMGALDACVPDARSQLRAAVLDDEELRLGEALDVAGGFWSFPYASDFVYGDTLVLRGGPRSDGWLRVDIADPLAPEIERYTTTAPQ